MYALAFPLAGNTGCIPSGGTVRGLGDMVCSGTGLDSHLLHPRSRLPRLQDILPGQEEQDRALIDLLVAVHPLTDTHGTTSNTYIIYLPDLSSSLFETTHSSPMHVVTGEIFFICTGHM